MDKIKTTKEFINKVPYEILYNNLNKSNIELADYFNTTRTVIYNAMLYYNLKRTKEQSNNIRRQTCLRKYGVDNIFKDKIKIRKAMLEKYGVEHNSLLESTKQKRVDTYYKRTGYKYNSQNPESNKRKIQTCLRKYGVDNPFKNEQIKQKIKQTNLEKYGTEKPYNREKIKQTCLKKYGVFYACQRPECRKRSSSNSKPNLLFAQKLDFFKIAYLREYNIENYVYDFKVGNYLIEIDPFATHNSNNFIKRGSVDKYYHQKKSKKASQYNLICIHIFDWIDFDSVINGLLNNTIEADKNFTEPVCWAYNTKTKNLTQYTSKFPLNKDIALIWDAGQKIKIN